MYYFDGRIRYSETDSDGRLTFAALLNYFQDCSTFQSEDLGLGVECLRKQQRVWVLCSWQIVVERYPRLCDCVKIGTAPYEFKGFMGYRNFVMQTEDGEYLAKANSLWTLLDTETWRPAMPSEEIREKYVLSEKLDMEYAPRKIAVPQNGEIREAVTVKKYHLDTNHHVNNGQYVDIALEYIPEGFKVRQLRAEYKKQALLGDVMHPYVTEQDGRYVVALNDGGGQPYSIVEFAP